MKNVLSLIAFFSLTAHAETLKDKIHSVVEDPNTGSHIVRFSKGRVGFISRHMLSEIKNSIGADVIAELDGQSGLASYQISKAPIADDVEINLKRTNFDQPPPYEPTEISSEMIEKIFRSMDQSFKRLSECSDRAHVWAYDEYKNSGIKSEKAFIFFTASYINRVRFKWWFHVAPMFTIKGQKKITDVMYLDRPVSLKEWTKMMVFSGRDCKMTTKFSEYDVNPQTEDCYMIFRNMYYILPINISDEETHAVYRTQWNDLEVSNARSRAFDMGRIR